MGGGGEGFYNQHQQPGLLGIYLDKQPAENLNEQLSLRFQVYSSPFPRRRCICLRENTIGRPSGNLYRSSMNRMLRGFLGAAFKAFHGHSPKHV